MKAVDKNTNCILIEQEKTFKALPASRAWRVQQYAEMKAEHESLNAKQEYEVQLYNPVARDLGTSREKET